LLLCGGGIISSGSSLDTRRSSSLSDGSPGDNSSLT
jgi:hypothetical protein